MNPNGFTRSIKSIDTLPQSLPASKVHLNRCLFPVLQLFDQGLEVLQLMLHALMRIEVIPVTPVLPSVAQRVEREHLVNVPPGTFDPDGELGVDDVVPVLQSTKELAVVFVVPMHFVFRVVSLNSRDGQIGNDGYNR